jgi:hypothetical protein
MPLHNTEPPLALVGSREELLEDYLAERTSGELPGPGCRVVCCGACAGSPSKLAMVRDACDCHPSPSRQAKFDGCLFSGTAERQCQGAGERVEPGQEPQGKFLVVAVTVAAVELAQV